MVIPISFQAPENNGGPPSGRTLKWKIPMIVGAALMSAVFVWSFALVFFRPNIPGNRLPDSLIYGLFAGITSYCAIKMDVWWICYVGLMAFIYGMFSMVWFLDNLIRGAIVPFVKDFTVVATLSILWVPSLVLFTVALISFLIFRGFNSSPETRDPYGGTDEEERPFLRGNSRSNTSNFEPFSGEANRLGTN